MPKSKSGVATALDLGNHETGDWMKAHGIWKNVRPLLPGGIWASVYLNAETGLTSNDWTIIPFDTIVSDAANLYDETTDYDFTVASAGIYLIAGSVEVHYSGTATRDIRIGVFVNGSQVGSLGRFDSLSAAVMRFSGAVLMNLAVGDLVTVKAYCGGTATGVNAHATQAATNAQLTRIC